MKLPGISIQGNLWIVADTINDSKDKYVFPLFPRASVVD